MTDTPQLGKQQQGASPWFTKRMALDAKTVALGAAQIAVGADIGAGAGEFARALSPLCGCCHMLDFSEPKPIPAGVTFSRTDLNETWPLPSASIDFGFSLEVIEHVENPRHFMREFARVLKPGGFGFITTPNQHSWASKASFLLRGEHRFFAAPSYPAHITPLLKCDLLRMLAENNLAFLHWFYSNEDNLPLLHWRIKLPGAPFSACIGVLFRKPEHPQVSRQASDS